MAVPTSIHMPHLGDFPPDSGMISLEVCGDGFHRVGRDGVTAILATGSSGKHHTMPFNLNYGTGVLVQF